MALVVCATYLRVEAWTIAERGDSAPAQIFVASPGEPSAQYAATELQGYVRKLTGVELPIVERMPQHGVRI